MRKVKCRKMNFEELNEFRGDVKKYRSLEEDLGTVKKILQIKPNASPPFSFELNGLGLESCIIKVKKIACKSLKGRGVKSGLRLVYALFESEKRIVFIEIYHKNIKANANRERIIKYFK